MVSKNAKELFKKVRSVDLVNSSVRGVLRSSLITLPEKLSGYMLPKWKVTGTFQAKIDDIDFNFYCNGDDSIAWHLYYDQEGYDEIVETRLFAAIARISQYILDIGANTGLHAVLAGLANPKAKVLSFEPHQPNYTRLKKNLSLNNATNVEVVEKAVGETVGKVLFTVPLTEQISDICSVDGEFTRLIDEKYSIGTTYKEVEVDVVTLDDYILSERKLPRVDLIKIDVENYEPAVLRGAKQLLQQLSPIVFCEIHVDSERQLLYKDLLQPLGYYCYLVTPTGLVRTESLEPNPDSRNFFFTKVKTQHVYNSFHEGMDKVAAVLKAA